MHPVPGSLGGGSFRGGIAGRVVDDFVLAQASLRSEAKSCRKPLPPLCVIPTTRRRCLQASYALLEHGKLSDQVFDTLDEVTHGSMETLFIQSAAFSIPGALSSMSSPFLRALNNVALLFRLAANFALS
jgi:hypothetical protein